MSLSRRPPAGTLAALAALLTLGAAIAPDFLGWGQSGFGRTQTLLLLAGGLMLLTAFLATPRLGSFQGIWIPLGAAILGTAAGIIDNADLWAATGGGILVGAFLTDLSGSRAWWHEIRTRLSGGGKLWLHLLALAQACLLVLIIRQYHLENEAFYQNIVWIVLAGFALGFIIPATGRLQYFFLISLGGFIAVLGFRNVGLLLVPASILIGICLLPIAFRIRATLLLVVASVLALLRGSAGAAILPGAVWPILGSIFMFRLITFAYDLSHAKKRPTVASTLAYFFMLPNVVFPFFPVVDYTIFRRSSDEPDQSKVHQAGLVFAFWGVTHLILYRAVNYYFMIPPEEVNSSLDLGRYLVANFALYLRVSGQFHLIIGFLHFFGFNLPRTNNKYFLASSFTDLWRRINIYWKDFMLKVFYYPIYFRLKKLGETRALVLSVMCVFLLTWFFHAYQWFWLRGTVLLTGPDVLFWLILGVLVVVNSVWEMRHGRQRRLPGTPVPIGERFGTAARTVGTFATMAMLWSLWSSQSVSEWLDLWKGAGGFPAARASALILGGGVLMAGVVAAGTRRSPSDASRDSPGSGRRAGGSARTALWKSTALTLLGFGGVYLAGHPTVGDGLGAPFERVMRDLRWSRLSQKDQAELERGYYENLNAVNSFNSQLWELYMRRPVYVPIWETDAVRETNDYLVNELNPDISIVFRGSPYRTNRWAMRDRDYEKTPPPGTFRAALLGDSIVEGWGVGNEENFDHLLEERLNAGVVPGYDRVELLNFAVGGYRPIQVMMTLERKAVDFKPQAAFLVAHPGDPERVVKHLIRGVQAGVENPYPALRRFTDEAGITPDMSEMEARRLLLPQADSALAVVYEEFKVVCLRHGIRPIWVYLPAVPGEDEPEERARMTAVASRAGFAMIDLAHVYQDQDVREVRIGDWDQHPSRKGHEILADALYDTLMARPELFSGGESGR